MSCFEIVFLAAAHAGVADGAYFSRVYEYVNAATGGNWMIRWRSRLSRAGNVRNYDNENPQLGDIVLFNQSANPRVFHHVALALGRENSEGEAEILSFYGTGNNQVTPIELTTIDAMTSEGGQCYMLHGNTTVEFVEPPWNDR